MNNSRNSDRSSNQKTTSPKHDDIEIIEFSTGEPKIRLNKKNTKTYKNQTKFDTASADNADVWHMVVSHHDGKYKKSEIIENIFAVAEHAECYIVGYRRCSRDDYFLIRLCRHFIGKLFHQCLKFKMQDGPFLYATVKLNVADYKLGQNAFTERCNNFELFEGVAKVLNLDNFAKSPEFAELIFTLSNKSALGLLCSTLAKHSDIFKIVNELRLSNNELVDLSPFSVLPSIDIQLIDLRNNKISDVNQLKHLQKTNFSELFVANNPITKTDGFMARIQEILPNIVKVDGNSTRNILPSLFHLGSGENTIEVIFQGDVIQSNESLTPQLFRKYKTSDMWHQVLINHNGKYAK